MFPRTYDIARMLFRCRTLASVSTTLLLQNGHMVGRVTVLSNRESIGNLGAYDIRIPRAQAAFAEFIPPDQ